MTTLDTTRWIETARRLAGRTWRAAVDLARASFDDLTRPASVPILEAIRRERLRGLAALALLFVGFGGWAATSELAGAVIAAGSFVVEGDVKKIQHQTGGTVAEIRAQDGQTVGAGEVLLRLDETVDQANLTLLVKQIDEAEGRRARLEAERDGAASIAFPSDLTARRSDAWVARILDGETTLFDSRAKGRQGQKSQLRERITQLGEEIAGFEGQIAAKKRELGFIGSEKKGIEELVAKKLVPITRLNALQRDEARLLGEVEQLRAGIAQSRGKTAEIELQILQLDQDARTDVLKDLRELQGKIGDLVERRVAAEDRLRKIEIRAPIAGVVHQMTVHTIGGVIAPGEVFAQIVPATATLAVEARVSPHDIDQVAPGHRVFVRMTSLNQRTTPELEGTVSRIGANLTQEKDGSPPFYAVRVEIPEVQLDRLGKVRLVPGMPAEVHIRTESRTALSYLLKPLLDSMARAGREK